VTTNNAASGREVLYVADADYDNIRAMRPQSIVVPESVLAAIEASYKKELINALKSQRDELMAAAKAGLAVLDEDSPDEAACDLLRAAIANSEKHK
jgi:hypothetical protein